MKPSIPLLLLAAMSAHAAWTWNAAEGSLTADGAGATPAGTALSAQAAEAGAIRVTGFADGAAVPLSLDLSEPADAAISEIGDGAFAGNATLRRVFFPAALVRVGDGAFRDCPALQETGAFPATLAAIGADAFAGCSNLVSQIALPASLVSLGAGAFDGSAVSGDLAVPEGLASVPARAFRGTRVTSLRAASGAPVSIGPSAFEACASLHTAVLGGALVALGDPATGEGSVFRGCASLASCDLPASLAYVGPRCFQGSGLAGDVVWPAAAREVPAFAFAGTRIASFAAPAGPTNVGSRAFASCAALRKVVLPDTLEAVAADWAKGVSGLEVFWRACPPAPYVPAASWNDGADRVYRLSRASADDWKAFENSEWNTAYVQLPSDDNAAPGRGGKVVEILWWDDEFAPADPIGLFVE